MNIADIRESTEDFHLLETTGLTQTATIMLAPGAATSSTPAIHPHSDQVLLVIEGEVVAEVDGNFTTLRPEQSIVIPAAVKHRFVNAGTKPVFAFTVYGPPAYQTDDPT